MGWVTPRLRTVLVAGLSVLAWGRLTPVCAANPDTLVVSVSPNVTYGVTVSSVTGGVGYQFGNVNLGATTQSTAAIVLTNSGNVSEYFSLAMNNTSGNWTLTTSAPGTDTFRVSALLQATQPLVASFTDFLSNPPVPGAAATLYGQASTKTAPTAAKNLWLRLEMPTALSVGTSGAQTTTLYVNGQGS